MSLLATIHAALVILTYHSGGDINPFVSIFVSTPVTGSFASFPFQPFGLFALVILVLMAATSHDFWLANLSPPVWKSLHMLVYVAYALLIFHVTFGVLQSELSPLYVGFVAIGFVIVLSLHIAAALREIPIDREIESRLKIDAEKEGFVHVCSVSEIPENRARIFCLSGERVAVFKYDGKISAVSNVCQHQNGPLGEGRILDGCITCPWHGYQYRPETGASPPPFVEKVPTFNVRVEDGRVLIHPKPNAPGTRVEPALISTGTTAAEKFQPAG